MLTTDISSPTSVPGDRRNATRSIPPPPASATETTHRNDDETLVDGSDAGRSGRRTCTRRLRWFRHPGQSSGKRVPVSVLHSEFKVHYPSLSRPPSPVRVEDDPLTRSSGGPQSRVDCENIN